MTRPALASSRQSELGADCSCAVKVIFWCPCCRAFVRLLTSFAAHCKQLCCTVEARLGLSLGEMSLLLQGGGSQPAGRCALPAARVKSAQRAVHAPQPCPHLDSHCPARASLQQSNGSRAALAACMPRCFGLLPHAKGSALQWLLRHCDAKQARLGVSCFSHVPQRAWSHQIHSKAPLLLLGVQRRAKAAPS